MRKNDTHKDMSFAEFKKLLDIHGGDFSRWPEDKIRPACHVLETNAAARDAHKAALALDEMLALHQAGPLPDIVPARVAQIIDRAPARPLNDNFAGLSVLARGARAPQWALAACAVVLLLLGFVLRPSLTASINTIPDNIASTPMTEIELFLLAMADPFIETLRTEELMAPLETAALQQPSYDIDLFLDDLWEEELDDLFTP